VKGGWATKKKTKNYHRQQWGNSPEKGPSSEPRINPSISIDSKRVTKIQEHQVVDVDKTNAAVLSDSASNAWIESNCSPKMSLELELPRTSASNSGVTPQVLPWLEHTLILKAMITCGRT
jgi:hypothetical protein